MIHCMALGKLPTFSGPHGHYRQHEVVVSIEQEANDNIKNKGMIYNLTWLSCQPNITLALCMDQYNIATIW